MIRRIYVLTLVRSSAASTILRPGNLDGTNGSVFRRRIDPMDLQHRHPLNPHTSRDYSRREMGSRSDMVPWRHCLHHRRHSPSLRVYRFSLRQDPHLDASPSCHRRG